MPDSANNPVELYRARNLIEAQTLLLLLEAEGVTATIENEPLQGAFGEIPWGWETAPRMVVRRVDEDSARALLERFLLRQRVQDRQPASSETNCLACGEPMVADVACVKCGWSYCETGDSPAEVDPPGDGESTSSPESMSKVASDAEHDSFAVSGLSDRELWLEVMAVLAVGVIPHLRGLLPYQIPRGQLAYWIEALDLVLQSACVIFVTFYLMGRSGERLEVFGITRPRWSDLLIAAFLFWVSRLLASIWWNWIPESFDVVDDGLSPPKQTSDCLWMVLMYGFSAMAEEIVTRAYLITRFTRLLRSQLAAIVVAATMFASSHAYQGPAGVINAMLFGLLFGAAFLLIRSIWPLVIAHALANIVLEFQSLTTHAL